MDFSSGSTEAAKDRQRAFDLAIKHVNNGGGVFGRVVAVAYGDTTANPETAVAVTRHLVEVEGVHAIVGPTASANALLIAERVIGPAGVPTISFSATSPKSFFCLSPGRWVRPCPAPPRCWPGLRSVPGFFCR